MSDPSRAVFLSYASQDAEAARRICQALRAAGIEVWFDQSELRGGEVWDQTIRRQIKSCALFIALISKNTHDRAEGYFRLEWKLAVDRSQLIMANKPFLFPVVIDETAADDEHVPERFRELQWTRLRAGETSPAFVDRVQRLLSGEASNVARAPENAGSGGSVLRLTASRASKGLWVAVVLIAAALLYYVARESRVGESATTLPTAVVGTASSTSPGFSPPPNSIAVLPFVNMSGDKDQEYFSDGLSEELLNDLARINELQVAARTSAFAFKGKDTDIGTIARKLNVGAVLEGSVRRSAHRVRVTAQLINPVSGFHVWSQTYDRNLGDVLKLQTEIAAAVTNALKVSLLGDVASRVVLGGTRDPAAFDAYLRGVQIARTAASDRTMEDALAAYTEAIRHDPHFATAFAERSIEQTNFGEFNARGAVARAAFQSALTDARTAVQLAPDLALAHYALGVALETGLLQFAEAAGEFERAAALAPGSARIVAAYSRHAAELRHIGASLAAGRRAIALDPLNFHVHRTVGIALLLSRRYEDASTAFQMAISLQPGYLPNYVLLGEARYGLGDLQGSRTACARASESPLAKVCLAKSYQRMGRSTDAEAALQALKAAQGDDGAYDYATIYAQWGDTAKALDWLETAVRLRDSSLTDLKAEPDLDPLRKEPRFQAIERDLKFPD